MILPRTVQVVEVGPRDGFQMEKTFIATETKIEIVNALARCGFPKMEVTSFISHKAIPQMSDAAKVIAGIDRSLGVRAAALVPNPKGAENAAAAGVDEMVTFVSATESHNRSNVNRTIAESLAGFKTVMKIAREAHIQVATGIAVAFGCPFEGDVPAERVAFMVGRLLDLGVHAVTLGDTTGLATPPIVARTCEHLLKLYPDLKLSLHFHNTRGIGLVNVFAALELGITTFESSVGGLGGCPFAPGATGNVCTEDMVYMFKELGILTGIDLDELIKVARRVEGVIGRPLPGQVMKSGTRSYRSPLPKH
ncbi:MAG: hydroxymethylglutaryl-CoA lyase [Deltaproteobacteria bacterium]|nr:hydroxymethylglutaryl-CoA lyase [Deltaproteobacteria bacterium]